MHGEAHLIQQILLDAVGLLLLAAFAVGLGDLVFLQFGEGFGHRVAGLAGRLFEHGDTGVDGFAAALRRLQIGAIGIDPLPAFGGMALFRHQLLIQRGALRLRIGQPPLRLGQRAALVVELMIVQADQRGECLHGLAYSTASRIVASRS